MDKFGGFENAMKVSPREDQIARVVENIQEPLELPLAEINRDIIYLAMKDLQGANYSHYVHPSDDTLAQHAKELLTKKLDELPVHSVIVMEFCMFNALQMHHAEWLRDTFLLDTTRIFPVFNGDPSNIIDPLVSYTRSKSGHRIMITRSFFIAFAEKVNVSSRFHSIQSYKVCLDLWLSGGNMIAPEHDRQINILRSFLMGIEDPFGNEKGVADNNNGSETNYRSSRILAMPTGYFGTPGPSSMLLGKAMKIGVYENEVLRRDLGANKYGKLLLMHGVVLKDLNCSPLDAGYTCCGIPAFGTFEAEECNHTEKLNVIYCIVGSRNHNLQTFRGHIVCTHCHRKLEAKERNHLLQMQNLTGEETERLDKLLTYRQNHRKAQSKYALTKKASDVTLEEVELARQKQRDRNRKPPAQKIGPTHHKYKCKGEMYPAELIKTLHHASKKLIYELNREVILYGTITSLYTEILQREHLKFDFDFKVVDGLVSYNSTAYGVISSEIFGPVNDLPRHRSVKEGYTRDVTSPYLTGKVAIQNVLQWLYAA